jgi:hypothetical protein
MSSTCHLNTRTPRTPQPAGNRNKSIQSAGQPLDFGSCSCYYIQCLCYVFFAMTRHCGLPGLMCISKISQMGHFHFVFVSIYHFGKLISTEVGILVSIYSHSNSPCSFAGIAPFYLYACHEKPWMCPVRLFARWWALSDGSKGGYVFRKKMGNRFSANPFERMVSPLVYSDLISISHRVRRLNHSWTASVTTSVISTLILGPTALIPSVGGVVNILPWCSAGPSVTSVPGEVGQKTSTTLAPYSNISSPGQTPPCLNVKITLIQTKLAVILAPPVAALFLVYRHLRSRYKIRFISYKTFRKYRYMVSVIMVQCPSTNNKELFKNNKVVRLKVTIVLIARFL